MIKRTTQKECRRLIATGAARELNTEKPLLRTDLDCIAIGRGVYGMNCAVFRDRYTGELYTIPRRASILFYYI